MAQPRDAFALGYRRWWRCAVGVGGALSALVLVVGSAIAAKEASFQLTPLARASEPRSDRAASDERLATPLPSISLVEVPGGGVASSDEVASDAVEPQASVGQDLDVRWFNGRPVRPSRTIVMTVTAYSPDHRSCGVFADGKTATLHSVWTNGGALVAADTRLLPFGSMLTVPGYDDDRIVPVLDRGGAIKGHRLDVLFPTHREARQWGVRELPVVVWAYADGLPAPNPRTLR
ncbi:MAG: 3D domain-containing protein [Planctomycetota bacterium]